MTATISSFPLGNLNNFIYFITDDATGKTFSIDPAFSIDAIEAHVAKRQLDLHGVLLTHSHADHVSALDDMLKKYKIPTYITREEFRLGRARVTNPNYISDGDQVQLGETAVTVYETGGHTVGSACFHINNDLIAGDTIFIDGCGRCNFYESDVKKMWDSLQRLKQLPDETIIHPGHDYGQKATDTMGNQKKTNPYLLIEDKDFFIEFRTNLQSQYRSIPFAPSSYAEMQAIQAKHS